MHRSISGVTLLTLAVTLCGTGLSAAAEPPSCRPPVSALRLPESLTFCGAQVPLDRPDIRERLEREFYYMMDKEGQLVLYIKRAGRSNPVVEPLLESAGLPTDLKYVPVAESGLLFRERSAVGAVGYWQFMAGTARRYGLRVDRFVDERRDLRRSTRAAARYLRDLHREFGSWETALAAYNWGESRLKRAIEEQGTSLYYDLYLPDETDRFVFRILFFKLIIENAEAYSIFVPASERYSPPPTVEVEVETKSWVPVEILARSASVPPRTFRFLNPWLLRNVVPRGTHSVTVPAEQKAGFRSRVAALVAAQQETLHKVRRGENLSLIASRYGVTVRELERWNGISRRRPIRPGQELVILRAN